jgi:glycosyltransferase involved in cell wall biosynthesis
MLEEKINTRFGDSFLVGSIGELHKNKGYGYAIDAFKDLVHRHPSLKYVIIGDGEQHDMISHHIQHEHLEDTVYLAGYIDNAPQLMKAFDLFLMPSRKEGLPYVLLEAGMAKVPCIATRIGGIPDLIEHAKEGMLIKPKSSVEIVNAVQFALDNRDTINTYAQQLYEKFSAQHTIEHMMALLTAVYTEK